MYPVRVGVASGSVAVVGVVPEIIVMVMIVMVMIVMVIIGCGTALTGRVRRHSAAGLTVVAAAALPLTDLDQVVGQHHPQLRGK